MSDDRTVSVVLVHGSYHGAWCWDLLTPELERRGYAVTAVDLPVSDPDAGASAYADAIVDQVDWSTPPVIVGHSMSTLVALHVAQHAKERVERVVLITPPPPAGFGVDDATLAAMQAMARGEKDRTGILATVIKDKVRELV